MIELTDTERTDYDETRRLLYMALCAPHTKRYNLAGTLVNALAHHQKRDADINGLISQVCEAVDGNAEDTDWIWGEINLITTVLDAQP